MADNNSSSPSVWVWYEDEDGQEVPDRLPWPPGWPIPRIGDRIQISDEHPEVNIEQIQWDLVRGEVNLHVEICRWTPDA